MDPEKAKRMEQLNRDIETLVKSRVEPGDYFNADIARGRAVAQLGVALGAVVDSIAVPVDQTRDDTLLGASEAAAVLGLDRYRSPMSVWLAKRAARAGEQPPPDERPAFVNEAAEWGVALEPIIRGKYALAMGARVEVPRASVPHDGWLRCTPDGVVRLAGPAEVIEWRVLDAGVILRTADAPYDGLLQVKTCSAYKADEWSEGVPPAYEVQVRVEMAVCDLPWCDVVCLVGGQRYVGPFRITRDLAIEERILRDLRAFWDLVLSGTPPSVDDSEAWKQHASSFMRPTKVAIPADDECRAFLVELRMARTEKKAAEKRESELKTQVLLRLGAAGATVLEGGDLGKLTAYPNPARMGWKEYAEYLENRTSEITPSLRSALVEIRDRFKKPGNGWAIRTPRDWSGDEDE